MNPEAAKRFRLLASAISVLVVLAFAAAGWFYWRVRTSLPLLDGRAKITGLTAAVTVTRDALGVPTIRGGSRADVARALGWLHAQDRFFQMDLLRRSSAGELGELFGKRALPHDRAMRMHGFRSLARQVTDRLPPDQRAVLDAYTAGANAGLTALRERPFEYLVLRSTPQPWRPEDTILIVYAMTVVLQDETGAYEQTLMTLRDQLGADGLAFFAPLQTPADAALDGSTALIAPIPGPEVIDLRKQRTANTRLQGGAGRATEQPGFGIPGGIDHFLHLRRTSDAAYGSNAMALAGPHTASGAALLANDMHLDLGVPNIWYRASLEWNGEPSNSKSPPPTPEHRVTGVTLPGTPVIVAGSNGRVAWGFTASYADTGDLVVVERVPGLLSWYSVAGDPDSVAFEERRETILVKGASPVVAEYRWTKWGPIVGSDERGRPLAYRWVAHDASATDLGLMTMETATDVASGISIAHRAGIPAQNILLADAAGHVAWTIAGRLPKRAGYDGRLPTSWRFGDRRWDGLLPPEEVPVLTTNPTATNTPPKAGPPSEASAKAERLWSANHRHVGGAALAKIGDGGYPRPNRAAQIRDALATLERAAPRDLLAVQLDDRALFLAPWHRLLLETLTPAMTAQKKSRAALHAAAVKWEGRAGTDAVGYRLAREFRSAVHERVFPALFASCLESFPAFRWRELQLEGAIWALLREKPPHLLNPKFSSWDDLMAAACDDVVATLDQQGVTPGQATWGRLNTARIRHPFSSSFPWLSGWLDLPSDPLPGDNDLPRVQTPTHGASERCVVSPGRETEGIFHMPGGQSGHPLSPYYRAGHTAWVRGEPTPFLPGRTEHTLTLVP